jgi:multiple sugar transport system ATP-binding protein
MNLLPGRVAGADGAAVWVDLPAGGQIAVPVQVGTLREGDSVTLGIRPEALRLSSDGALAGQVHLVERLGSLTLLHVGLAGGETVVVQSEGSDGTQARQAIRLAVDPADYHVFDTAGISLRRPGRHELAA